MRSIFQVAFCLYVCIGMFGSAQNSWAAPNQVSTKIHPDETRVETLLSQLTLDEKLSLLSGTGFATLAIPRLNIPALTMTDGPVGVRFLQSTAFPVGIAMGASFDPQLVGEISAGIARDALAHGRYMLLGPCVNLSRQPFGGRNFESFGEDPLLSSQIATGYVKGVQSQGVISTVKHFALNEQEFERRTISTEAEERTIRELHFPAFKAAVDAGVWAVMSSYNRVNGIYASENSFLLQQVLKGEWAFQGLVVSDWEAVHSTIPSANNGLDLEMPTGVFFGDPLKQAVASGAVSEATINDKVRRILRVMDVVGLLDGTAVHSTAASDPPENHALALRLAQESIVLLKNAGNILPLNPERTHKLAVIGPNAATARVGGGGSSMVQPYYSVSPLEGMNNRGQKIFDIQYALGASLNEDFDPIDPSYLRPDRDSAEPGVKVSYFPNMDLSGEPALIRTEKNIYFDWGYGPPAPGIPQEHFSARFEAILRVPNPGTYTLASKSDDGMRIFLDGKEIIADWGDHPATPHTVEITLEAGRDYELRVDYYQDVGYALLQLGFVKSAESQLQEAVDLAKKSDAAVLFIGLSDQIESEDYDRETLELPENQRNLINAVIAANPNTILVNNSGAVVLLHDWPLKARAIVQAWYPGQEGGNAIADILFGNISPSGKLPFTWVKRWEDHSAFGFYPGADGKVSYGEGVFLGYRFAEANQKTPDYPFGFGLSYTKFSIDNVQVNVLSKLAQTPEIIVEADIKNTGAVRGAEVLQAYVGESNPRLPRPLKELKGFEKTWLDPGETRHIQLHLRREAFAYFDPKAHSWNVDPGKFKISLGTSSQDISYSQEIELK